METPLNNSPNTVAGSIEIDAEAVSMPWHRRLGAGTAALAKDFGRNVSELWQAGTEDLEDASLLKKVTVGSTLGVTAVAMAADIPLHETYIAQVGTHVYTDSHGSTLATGLANGALSFGIEGVISTGIIIGLRSMPKVTNLISEKLTRKGKDDELGGAFDKGTYALSYGSGAFIFKNNAEKEQSSLSRKALIAAGAVTFLGVVNVGIGSFAAEILNQGEEHPEFAGAATDAVNVLKNPLTWLGFIATRIAVKKYLNYRKGLKQPNTESVESLPVVEHTTLNVNAIEA